MVSTPPGMTVWLRNKLDSVRERLGTPATAGAGWIVVEVG